MSWYSDGEPFDEHDLPWCDRCPHGDEGGDSYEECQACSRRHLEMECRAEGQRCETCVSYKWDFVKEVFYCDNCKSEWLNEEVYDDGWCDKCQH